MTRAELRAAMPECAAFIDWVREEFGADSVIAIRARENGNAVEWRKNVLHSDDMTTKCR